MFALRTIYSNPSVFAATRSAVVPTSPPTSAPPTVPSAVPMRVLPVAAPTAPPAAAPEAAPSSPPATICTRRTPATVPCSTRFACCTARTE